MVLKLFQNINNSIVYDSKYSRGTSCHDRWSLSGQISWLTVAWEEQVKRVNYCYLKNALKHHCSHSKHSSHAERRRSAPSALTILALVERRQVLTGLQRELLELMCNRFAVRAGSKPWLWPGVILSIRCPQVIHRVKPPGDRESKRSLSHPIADKANKEKKTQTHYFFCSFVLFCFWSVPLCTKFNFKMTYTLLIFHRYCGFSKM